MRRPQARQRGVAVITALLLTTLAVTIVASLFWQQQVQVRSMENQRLHLQTKWILRGALDWARLVLNQDGHDYHEYTSLAAVWNTPLAETRLDQYIERERVEGEVFDATLSGRIVDATSRYNLRNLAKDGMVAKEQVEIYQRLLQNLQVEPGLAARTAKAVADSMPAQAQATGAPPLPAAAAPPTQPMALSELDDLLAIPGYTPAIIAKLREFVIVLPEPTPVNANTAPAEVLAALVPNYSVSEAHGLVARRKQAYYRQMSDFTSQLYGKELVSGPNVADIKSTYFLVYSRIRLDRAALDAEALISRKLNQTVDTTLVSIREN